jgi:antitoxin component YwqK of YwqJK toxin-antitoxin module
MIILVGCKRPTEKVISTYLNGQVEWKFIYPDITDTTTYTKISFYEDGKKKCIANYLKGQENGEFVNFFPNAQVDAKWTMNKGKLEGTKYQYYLSGQQKTICNHRQGQEEGILKDWYESGKIQREGTFKNDKRNGLWKYYRENGNYDEKTFLNDSLEGATKEIIADTLYVYGQYSHNKEVGKWTWKIKDKILFKTQVYSDGNETGEIIFYHPNGKPFHVGQLINGKLQGERKTFNDQGKLIKIEHIKNDTLESAIDKMSNAQH